MRLPSRPLMTKPAAGNSGISQIRSRKFILYLDYHFIRSISLMFIVSLFLNIAMTIPSPTAASAAATVMTKIANT